jgi:hypothetical protein
MRESYTKMYDLIHSNKNVLQQSMPCRYNLRLLDNSGWNFRHAHFHEEGRRTLYKAYGIKFVVIVHERAGGKVLRIL